MIDDFRREDGRKVSVRVVGCIHIVVVHKVFKRF